MHEKASFFSPSVYRLWILSNRPLGDPNEYKLFILSVESAEKYNRWICLPRVGGLEIAKDSNTRSWSLRTYLINL